MGGRYGRPRITDRELCTSCIRVPVPPTLRQALEEQAEHEGFPNLASFVRLRLLEPVRRSTPVA